MRKLYVFLFGIFAAVATNAQVSSYTFSQANGTFTSISGTIVETATAVSGSGSLDSKAYTLAAGTIPFNFPFNGATYTGLNISSNGFITFGSTVPSTTLYTPISSSTAFDGVVSALARDLNALYNIAGYTGDIRYEAVGSAPNREFVVQWTNFRPYSSSTAATPYWRWNVQIRLHENGSIAVVYDMNAVGTPTASTVQVGLRGATNSDYNIRTSSTTWTGTTAGTSNSATVSYSSSNLPPSGLTFTWTPPSCLPPTGITASNVTTTSATLNWSAPSTGTPSGYTYEVRISGAGGSGATGLVASGTTAATSVGVSSLTPGTVYSVYLQTSCSGGSASGWSAAASFMTQCVPLTTPTASAETFATFPPSVCWTRATGLLGPSVTLAAATTWVQDDFGNVTSPVNKSAKLNIYGTSRKEWLITPSYDLGSGGNLQLEFDLALTLFGETTATSLGADDKFAVLISTDNGATWSDANVLRNWNSSTPVSNTGEHVVISLASYSGVVKFAFYGESTVSNVDNDLFVDNLSVNPIPACSGPGSVSVSAVTNNSATLSWTPPGNAPAGYDVFFSTSNTAPDGNTTPTATNVSSPYNLTGLSGNTTYYVWVRGNCGAGGVSTWTTILASFVTDCDPASLLNQNFDGVTAPALPACWSKILRGTGLSSFATVGTSTSSAHTGSNSVEMYNSSTGATDDIILVSPRLSNLSAGTYQLRFWAKNSTASQDLVVGTLSDKTSAATFTPLTTLDVTTTFQEFAVSFSSYSGTDKYIGIRRLSTSTYTYVYVDDIVWEPIPTTPCVAPADQATTLAFGAQGTTSQAGSFTAAASNPSGYLVVRSVGALSTNPVDGTVYNTGGTLGNGTVVQSGSATAFTASSLTGNTAYTYTVFDFNSVGCLNGPAYNTVGPLTGTSTTCPVTPASVSVSNLTSTGFRLNWTSSKGGGAVLPLDYTVDVSTENTFTTGVINGSPFVITDSTTVQTTMRLLVTGLNPTTQYYYRIKGNGCNTAYSSTASTTTLGLPPANDDATGAVVLTVGSGCSGNPYTNANATQGANEPYATCRGNAAGYSTVWFAFVAPASGMVRISNDYSGGTMGSDSRISLYSAADPANYNGFALIGCDDDNGTTVSSRSILYATGLTAGTTYYIQVDGYSSSTTTGTFCITVDELTSAMLSAPTACTAGQDLSSINTGYNGWLSLTDNSGKLVAMVKDLAGNGGTFSHSNTLNTGAVRQNAGIHYLDRNYFISNTASTNVKLQFFFLVSELAALNAANGSTLATLGVTRQTGTACKSSFASANGTSSFLPQTANGTVNDLAFIEVNTPGFSNFYLNKAGVTLPANLLTFSGVRQGTSNLLKWVVAQETDVQAYEIERSENGRSWTNIGRVNSMGNSAAQRGYAFTDNGVAGLRQYYRLRQLDVNGVAKLSQTVVVNGVKATALVLSGLFPNPAATMLNAVIETPGKDNVTLSVIDAVGRVVKVQKASVAEGANTVQLNVTGLSQGAYLLKVTGENSGASTSTRFVKE